MWLGAKLTLKKLLYDDSGVAMTYTVLVSLFIFMLCVSTYAMTENIRQKMELQNACDAAAYSGAVVQADMLSRIAVLNRALSWTYAQSSKLHMDYIVDTWIGKIQAEYTRLRTGITFSGTVSGSHSWDNTCRTCGGSGSVACSSCDGSECLKCGGDGLRRCGECGGSGTVTSSEPWNYNLSNYSGIPFFHFCTGGDNHGEALWHGNYLINGWFVGWDNRRSVQLNRSQEVLVASLFRIVNTAYTTNLNNSRTNITTMNNEIAAIRANMNTYIASAVDDTMSYCTSDNYTYCVDSVWRGGTLPAASYFSNLRNEAQFLDFSGHTINNFQTGAGIWWNDTTTVAGGIQRSYVQGARALRARFRYWARLWVVNPYTGIHHNMGYTIPYTTSADVVPTPEIGIYGAMVAARPVTLTRNFFGQDGAILVAAKKSMVNPFEMIFGENDSNSGLYGAFNGTKRDMWTVSTARAGLRFNTDGTGNYRVQWPGTHASQYNTNSVWNLCEEDWDAVMLPVARAWNDTTTNAWGNQSIDATTSNLLNRARTALGVSTPYTSPVSSYNPFNPGAVKR